MGRLLARAGLWATIAATLAAAAAVPAAAASPDPGATPGLPSSHGTLATWEQWQHLPGIFDLAGPRSDGALLLAAGGQLSLLGSGGSSQPYARGLGGYQVDYAGEPEAYVAVAAGQRDDTLGCTFNRDSTFVLDVSKTAGVIRVDAAGVKTRFADIPADGVNGITFDTTGKFGNRLIVTGPKQGKTAIYTIDCTGKVHAVTETAPTLEGGIVVAPAGFTGYGGALIAPDELSGKIYAIDQDGGVRLVATSTLATGGDIGVESGGFIPAGFSANSGYVYVADRSTPGNPHPGTDTLLRLSAADLKPTGVNDGDLLIATEGGDLLEAVHCAATCTIRQVADAPVPAAHGEGHVLVVANKAAATAGARAANGSSQNLLILLIGAVVLLLLIAAIAVVLVRRRNRHYLGPAAGG